jgi:hypothetical protein
MPEMLLETFPTGEFRTPGEDSNLVAGIQRPHGNQAVERIPKLARQSVVQLGRSIFGTAPVIQHHRFSPSGELHLEGSRCVQQEGSANTGNFEFPNLLQVGRTERILDNGFLNVAL